MTFSFYMCSYCGEPVSTALCVAPLTECFSGESEFDGLRCVCSECVEDFVRHGFTYVPPQPERSLPLLLAPGIEP